MGCDGPEVGIGSGDSRFAVANGRERDAHATLLAVHSHSMVLGGLELMS